MAQPIVHAISDKPPATIARVEFGIPSPHEIRAHSVVEVTSSAMYKNGKPCPHGINDHRMGCIDKRVRCGTCGNKNTACIGHFGHIELGVPIYMSNVLDWTVKCLRATCFMCSRVCVSDVGELESRLRGCSRRGRFQRVLEHACKPKRCPFCDFPRAVYGRMLGKIVVSWTPKQRETMTPEEIELISRPFTAAMARHILSGISDADCVLMGIDPAQTRPENTVLLAMPVCPPVIRPSTVADCTHLRGQDDITQMLQSINKRAQAVRALVDEHKWDALGDADMPEDLLEAATRLQNDVAVYYDQPVTTSRFSTSRVCVTLKERLSHKDGRMRNNLMGKRTNFSARTVISPDPLLPVEEVGVPISVATAMTIPERVCSYNLADLQKRVSIGAGRLGGAQSVITAQGTIELGLASPPVVPRLQNGDVVERYIKNGDLAIFNRQPSLHCHSMCAHKIRIKRGSTFTMNLSPTSMYNADFDGDEMNLHIPQSIPAQSEMRNLMMARCHLIGAKANKPVMGAVQDSLLGAYMLTDPATRLSKREVACLLYRVQHASSGVFEFPRPLPRGPGEDPVWTGCSIVSCLLPAGMCLHKGSLKIVNGSLVSGRMDKSNIGMSSGGVVQTIAKDYGANTAIDFLSDLQRMANQYITTRGFGVGVGDCVMSKSGNERAAECVENAIEHIEAISRATKLSPGVLTKREIEMATVRILSRISLHTCSIVETHTAKRNRIRLMGDAGSKGNKVNWMQILAYVGQNTVGGDRLGLDPHSHLSYYRPEHEAAEIGRYGFVANNYTTGLTPIECFHHAMGGREGLVDTAVKTATTGYFQRRCVKAVEDYKVNYAGAVVCGEGRVLQYAYGGDGLDAVMLEKVSLDCVLHLPVAKFAELFHHNTEVGRAEHADIEPLISQLVARQWGVTSRSVDTSVHLPTNPMRIFERAAYMRGAGDVDDPALSRGSVHARVHAVCARIAGLTASPDALLPYLVAIRFSFRSANACASLREVGFAWALGEMYESAKRALVHPGKSVGVLAAQSVGEPLTQLTLNTFHLSGVSSIHQTQGIPRFKELVDMTKNGKAEVMAVSLLPDVSREEAERLAESWVQTTLLDVGAFVRSSSSPSEGRAAGLDGAAQARFQMALIFDPPPAGLDHVVMAEQFVFNKDVMVARSITLEDMRRAVQGKWDAVERAASPAVPVHGRFVAFEQPDAAWRLVLCCYTLGEHAADADVRRRLLDQLNVVAKQRLFGLEGVSATAVQPTDSGGPDDQEPTVLDANVPARGHVITTAGTCLEDVVAIERVDADLTYGSDVHEMYALYGIEAAAHLLYSEFFRTLSYDGNYINSRHLLMLVDFMTHTGALIPLSRFGINRLQRGVLQRCSFEEATDMLENAGFFGEADHMNGVSQSVIAGAPVKFGTGYHSAVETTIISPCQQEQRADAEFVKPNVKRSRVRSRINTAPKGFELRFEKPGSNTPYSPPTP